jgi:hypothetical protein
VLCEAQQTPVAMQVELLRSVSENEYNVTKIFHNIYFNDIILV